MKNINILSCNKGASLVLVGVSFMLLLLVTAIAVDMGRIYAVQSKAQTASDAALLGAVATQSTTDIETEFHKLFNSNYPSDYMDAIVGDVAIGNPSFGVHDATFQVTVPLLIMNLFGDPLANVDIYSQVVGGYYSDNTRKLELAMVLDNTGSMGNGGKMPALKAASKDLVKILFGDKETLNNLHVSVVPYDILVNIGLGKEDWIQEPSKAKYRALEAGLATQDRKPRGFAFNRFTDYFCGPYPLPQVCWDDYWTTCGPCTPGEYEECSAETGICEKKIRNCNCKPRFVPAGCRIPTTTTCTPNGLSDFHDGAPTTNENKFRLPYERMNETTNYIVRDSYGEHHRWAANLAPILFSSNVKADIFDAINEMKISGTTRINVGLMWGWFTLSPNWAGVWDSAKSDLPAAFGPRMDKAIVLMTDGKNIYAGDDERTQRLCEAVKAQGIKLYTVGFGSGDDINEALLRECASLASDYFHAPTEDELRVAFKQIGDDLLYNTLRLSQ